MSLGEADAKFPNQGEKPEAAPSPTRENPAAVYPKSSPEADPSAQTPGQTVTQGQGAPGVRHTEPSDAQGLTSQEGGTFKE
ncbi:hypothetical protein DL93DRAFT_2167113 [Clavulina sp. PMI_390]|nr:hypothetical protein DL93DRAFT_2167113 [Clavulina sp. PMI_390]